MQSKGGVFSPQLPPHIINLIKTKNTATRKYLKTRNPYDKTTANSLKAEITNAINKHKRDNWLTFCNDINGAHISDAKLWRKLNPIDHSNQKQKPTQAKLRTQQGDNTSNPTTVSEMFANHLAL